MNRTILAIALSAALLAGCGTLAPDYATPAAPIPDQWPKGAAYEKGSAEVGKSAVDLSWDMFFTDPQLRRLIALARKIIAICGSPASISKRHGPNTRFSGRICSRVSTRR